MQAAIAEPATLAGQLAQPRADQHIVRALGLIAYGRAFSARDPAGPPSLISKVSTR